MDSITRANRSELFFKRNIDLVIYFRLGLQLANEFLLTTKPNKGGKMKKQILFLGVLLAQSLSFAAMNLKGTTTDFQNCNVTVNWDSNQVIFDSGDGGFEFNIDSAAIKAQLAQGQTSIAIDGQDGKLMAHLLLNFDAKQMVTSANYSQKYLIFSQEILCRHLR